MDDTQLKKEVLDALDFEPSVVSAHVGVTVDDGVVTLGGHVATFAERATAERVASRVRGVRGLVVEIEVRPRGDHLTADDEIARRVLHTLEWNTAVPEESIRVKVRNGWVTLTGGVEWQFQKQAAQRALHGLAGLRGLTNSIVVHPRAAAADIRGRIEEALKRDAELEAAGIEIEVEKGNVTLEGKVRNWTERRLIERAAWSVPCVRSVDDNISVTQ